MIPAYRLELTLLEYPGKDEAAQRNCHDEDEGECQGDHSGLHYPESHDARQLNDGKHVHAPCLHLRHKKVQASSHRRCMYESSTLPIKALTIMNSEFFQLHLVEISKICCVTFSNEI